MIITLIAILPNKMNLIKQISWRRISLCEIRPPILPKYRAFCKARPAPASPCGINSGGASEQPNAPQFSKCLDWSGCWELPAKGWFACLLAGRALGWNPVYLLFYPPNFYIFGLLRFELRLNPPKGLVLPLHYSPMKNSCPPKFCCAKLWRVKRARSRRTTTTRYYKYSLKPSGNQCLRCYFVVKKIYPPFKLSSWQKNGIIASWVLWKRLLILMFSRNAGRLNCLCGNVQVSFLS